MYINTLSLLHTLPILQELFRQTFLTVWDYWAPGLCTPVGILNTFCKLTCFHPQVINVSKHVLSRTLNEKSLETQ